MLYVRASPDEGAGSTAEDTARRQCRNEMDGRDDNAIVIETAPVLVSAVPSSARLRPAEPERRVAERHQPR